jgi:hypothetical protein
MANETQIKARRFLASIMPWNGHQVEVELMTGTKRVGQLSLFDDEMDYIRINVVEDGQEIGENIPLRAIARLRPIIRKLTDEEKARIKK